jgi:Predicted integral membrane protein (DUF2269)
MSFTDRLVLWIHIAFAVFAIGPVTIAIVTTPRYVRKRNTVVVRYLYRTTLIYSIVSLGVLIAGLVLADLLHDFSKPWLTVSLTLFIVALVLLALILRDQHGAIAALEDAEAEAEEAEAAVTAAAGGSAAADASASLPPAAGQSGAAHQELHLAHVERGRIASLGGVVALIWLVILVLMVWNG